MYCIVIITYAVVCLDGDDEDKRKIVRRYAQLIVNDIKTQMYEHVDKQTTETYIVQKDIIVFKKFVKRHCQNKQKQNPQRARSLFLPCKDTIGFLGWLGSKESASQCRRHGSGPLEKEMVTYSSTAWKMPWTEEPGSL